MLSLCRRIRLRFEGFFRIVWVYGMQGPQSVAGSCYAHVERMPPQPAVRLHQQLVRSAPLGGTPGFDQAVQKAQAHDRPAPRDGTCAAVAVTRRYDHARATLVASNIGL